MRNNPRRAIGVLSVTLLPLTGMVMLAGPTAAAVTPTSVQCGQTVTASTTLANDVGPCPGDGVVVTGSGIVLDLNGHRVFAANGPGDNAGIRLVDATGTTVTNGTVEGFDAGIAIVGGGGNTIRAVTARNNINDFQGPPCDLGDGITVVDSSNNRMDGNSVVHNGPFGGISLVGNSDGNLIRGNRVLENNLHSPPGSGCGNNEQDEGIRIEGPGANRNRVEGNLVERNLLAGVSLHGYVCHPRGTDNAEPEPANSDNFILGNTIRLNSGTGNSDGISFLQQGPQEVVVCPAFRNTILGNTVTGNTRDGIFLASNTADNTINGNVVDNNVRDGIHLNGPRLRNNGTVAAPGANNNTLVNNRGRGNGQFDGADQNPGCDNNRWSGDRFVKVNQPCVANGGTGTVPPGTRPPGGENGVTPPP